MPKVYTEDGQKIEAVEYTKWVVFFEESPTGEIRKTGDGHRYFALGSPHGGAPFVSMIDCLESLA